MKKVLLGISAMILLSGCQKMMDKYIESYLERKGPDAVEKVIDKIVAKRRAEAEKSARGPSLEERLKNRVAVDIQGAPMKGNSNAPITVVEYSDFQCPFCSRALPTVEQVLKQYGDKIKIVFKHNPLPFHPRAMPAAKASMAAHQQGKFWEMHDLLFKNQNDLSDANLKKLIKDLKLDVKKFEQALKDEALEKKINAEAEFARNHEAGGTPSFFIGYSKPDNKNMINGVLLVGAQPIDAFKEVIEALLKEKS